MRTIGVIGAGTMGSGIAEVAAAVGQVVLLDVDRERAEAGLKAIENASPARWKGAPGGRGKAELLARIQVADELQALKAAEVVVEAASENLELKQELFRKLAEICSPSVSWAPIPRP